MKLRTQKGWENFLERLQGVGRGLLIAYMALIIAGCGIRDNLPRSNPQFPMQHENPNHRLQGTVAYFDDASHCIWATAVSGLINKKIYCPPMQTQDEIEHEGKDVGWHLVWLSDNRLQITDFRLHRTRNGPDFRPAWQKIVDVRTLEIQEVPKKDIMRLPTPVVHPKMNTLGQRLVTKSHFGHVVVTLIKRNGTKRVLLDERGDPQLYGADAAYWSPDYSWVVLSDRSLLVITPQDEPRVRALTPRMNWYYTMEGLQRFAVTSAELLIAPI